VIGIFTAGRLLLARSCCPTPGFPGGSVRASRRHREHQPLRPRTRPRHHQQQTANLTNREPDMLIPSDRHMLILRVDQHPPMPRVARPCSRVRHARRVRVSMLVESATRVWGWPCWSNRRRREDVAGDGPSAGSRCRGRRACSRVGWAPERDPSQGGGRLWGGHVPAAAARPVGAVRAAVDEGVQRRVVVPHRDVDATTRSPCARPRCGSARA
jgi:hypothetical protein